MNPFSSDKLLHNVTQHLADSDWEPYEDCPANDKGVLDDQQLDDDIKKLRQEGNSNDATAGKLEAFQPDVHLNLHYVKIYYAGPQPDCDRATRVSEQSNIMQWRGEHLKCRVGFSFEASMPRCDWTIGLVQACDLFTLENRFEQGGSYTWEFQPMKTGLHTHINDSAVQQWPFYSTRNCQIDLLSSERIRPSFHELCYSDYFYPSMFWKVESEGRQYHLTSVQRRQGFKVWFIAIKRGAHNPKDGLRTRYSQFRPDHDEVFAMKSMYWRYNLDLKFDCNLPLGSRCTSIQDRQIEQPKVLDSIVPIPTSALVPPDCNSCQSLIFYPTNRRHPMVLAKAPLDTVVPWSEWCNSMTQRQGYDRFLHFEQPKPPPIVFPAYLGDPLLKIKTAELRHLPMLPPLDHAGSLHG